MITNGPPNTATSRLSSQPILLTIYGGGAAFLAYFCMYAFRKPFSAGTYEGLYFARTDVELKSAFVISQLIGYILSKLISIKVCSETTRQRRGVTLVGLIVWAEVALVFFALLPTTAKPFAMLLNGLSLGMVWGFVVRYLEGRLVSDPMMAGLCCSFILASGLVKSAGLKLMEWWNLPEFWMPSVTGFVFLPPFLLAVWMLERLPEPTAIDEAARVKRAPMDRSSRAQFVTSFFGGLVMLLIAYFFLTAYRSFRDDFQVEILEQAGIANIADSLAWTESSVAFYVMAIVGAMFLIRDRRAGLIVMFAIMICGAVLLAAGTFLYDSGQISGMNWMIATGLGGYLMYVPFNAVLFDRIIASTGTIGTAVFAISLADFIGYISTVPLMLGKDLLYGDTSRLEFFRVFTYWMSGIGIVLLISSCYYFVCYRRPDRRS